MGEHSNGLPFGMQVIADHFDERRMLNFSRQLEKVTVSE
jgi:Asp-tRNA(Asn)/Glu-tRNA(Gln) amidotransferase A subunit family amidase